MSENISNEAYEYVLFQTFQKIIGGTNVEMNRLRSYELNILSEVLLTVRERAENNEPLTLREVELLEKMHKRTYTSLDKLKTIIADTETFAYETLNKSRLKNKENA
jgi:hypothetical protein